MRLQVFHFRAYCTVSLLLCFFSLSFFVSLHYFLHFSSSAFHSSYFLSSSDISLDFIDRISSEASYFFFIFSWYFGFFLLHFHRHFTDEFLLSHYWWYWTFLLCDTIPVFFCFDFREFSILQPEFSLLLVSFHAVIRHAAFLFSSLHAPSLHASASIDKGFLFSSIASVDARLSI